MSEKRRDSRGRILRNGEIQESNGRYRFKYKDNLGRVKCVRSWRLDASDPVPAGEKPDVPLRELEKRISKDLDDLVAPEGGGFKVVDLVERYISLRRGVRPSTLAGYRSVIKLLHNDPFGQVSGGQSQEN